MKKLNIQGLSKVLDPFKQLKLRINALQTAFAAKVSDPVKGRINALKYKFAEKFVPAPIRRYLRNPYVVLGIVICIYLAKYVIKRVAANYSGSTLILSDAYNTLTDIIVCFMLIGVVRYSSKLKSKEYPFGPVNLEFLSALALGGTLVYMAVKFLCLCLVGLLPVMPLWVVSVAKFTAHLLPQLKSTVEFFTPLRAEELHPMDLTMFLILLLITVCSGVLSLIFGDYENEAGKRSAHPCLVFGGDDLIAGYKLESITAIGLITEYILQMPRLEYVFTLFIVGMIIRTSILSVRTAMPILLQHALPEVHQQQIKKLCMNHHGILEVVDLLTYQVGSMAVMVVTIRCGLHPHAQSHIKTSLTKQLTSYFKDQEMIRSSRIDIIFEDTPPTHHRMAFMLKHLDACSGCTVIANGPADAQILMVCNVARNVITPASQVHLPVPDLVFSLKDKHVKELIIFGDAGNAELEPIKQAGIEIVVATSFVPKEMGLQFSNGKQVA